MPDGFRIASGWVEVVPDLSGFRERLQTELDAALSGAGGDIKVGIDDARLLTALEDIRVQIAETTEATHDVRLTLEDHDTGERLEDIKLKLDEVGAKSEEAKVSVDTGDSVPKLAALDEELKSKQGDMAAAGNSAASFSARMWLIAAAVPAVAASIPALGGALAGLGGTAAAAGLAFKGVSQAISDYTALQGSADQSAAQMAATQFSNAVAIQNAQQAISSAEQQAAQDAITSAASIISAQQQVGASEHSYTDALFAEQQAQVSLTQARLQARLQLEQLNNAAIDGHLSVRAAELGLQQAKLAQQQTDQNAMSTQLQRQQAALAVAQAERQLIEAKQGEANATTAAQKADKQGVDGNPQVIAAKHALRDAIYQVTQARQAEANAQRALAQAQEQAAYTEARDAEAVATAQRNLTDIQRQQQLQMAATGNAAQKFANDMAQLTAPQRELVREFESFSGVLTRMEQIAGKAVLPGVTEFVKGLHAILPTVEQAMARFGGVVSSILGDLGRAFASKSFQRDLTSIIDQGVRFMRLLEPVEGMMRSLFDLWAKGGPATAGLARGLAAIATGLGDLFKALEPAIKPAGEILSVLGQAIGAIGGPLGKVVSSLLGALAPALKDLLPGFRSLLDALGTGLAAALQSLGPVLGPIATAISDIATALAPVLPVLGQLVAQVAKALAPVLQALVPVIDVMAQSIGTELRTGLESLMQALLPLLPSLSQLLLALVPLIKATDPLIAVTARLDGWLLELSATLTGPVIKALAVAIGWIAKALDAVTGWVSHVSNWEQAWSDFAAFISKVWADISQGVLNELSFIKGLFISYYSTIFGVAQRFWDSLRSGFSTVVSDLGTIWGHLETIFKAPINFLITTVYDHGIARLWDDVAGKIPGIPKMPVVPALSSGARIPGYGGGDRHPALLEAGETVVSKEHSRILEPLFAAVGVPGYAKGGKAGNTGAVKEGGGLLSSIFGGAWDVAKIVTAIMTGNTTAAANAFSDLFRTPASGDLGKLFAGLPKALVTDALKGIIGASGGGGGGLGGHASSNAIVRYAEQYLGKVPYVWGGTTPAGWDCSGMVTWDYGHFGFRPPRTSEEQFTWVRRTPLPVTGGLAFFAGADGTVGSPGHVGIVTGPNSMIDAYGTGFGTITNTIYGSSGAVSGFGVPPGGGTGVGAQFDSGGWMPPGPWNGTGQPEAVLTPEESRALVTMAKAFAAGQGGGTTVSQVFYGQAPTVEQQAEMRRDLALMLGGG